MSPNKLLKAAAFALILSALSLPLTDTLAGETKTEGSDVRILVPESLTSVLSGSEPSGEKRDSMSVQSTTGKKIALVGVVTGEPLPEVEVVNNGRSLIKPVFHGRYFHAQVILSLGVNMIEVRWRRDGGDWDVKTVSIFRSSKLEGGLSANYPAYYFHTKDREEQCQECHQMHLTRVEIETGMEKGCLKCHVSMLGNVHVHGPVGVGICTICHDPGSSPNKYQVQENDKALCYSCHTDRKDIDGKKKLQHGPVGAGLCTVCHDSHGSPFDFQLVKSKDEICNMCHQEDSDRWLASPSLHPPFKNGECYKCHDPHSSDYQYNLKASEKDICLLCHKWPIAGHTHEVGKEPLFNVPADFPLDENGKTMCLTCHDPHGAPGPHLTRRAGCDGCHPK